MMNRKLVVSLAAFVFLMGCANGGPNQTGGSLIGGAAGALLGSQIGKGHGRLAGVAVGTMLGSMIGSQIGQSMDERDRELAQSTTMRALERQADNRPVTWKNPNNNHTGKVVVTRTQESSNKVCRDYVQTVTIDGKQQQVAGRACRDIRDVQGQWIVQR